MQLEVAHSVVERMVQRGPAPTIRIGTSAYVSIRIRQHTSAYVSIRQRGPAPTRRMGAQFTCVTSRKIHILTQLLLYAYSERATRRVCATEQLALLVEKYTY